MEDIRSLIRSCMFESASVDNHFLSSQYKNQTKAQYFVTLLDLHLLASEYFHTQQHSLAPLQVAGRRFPEH